MSEGAPHPLEVEELRAERDLLRACLTAHHEISTLSDEAIHDAYAGNGTGLCPICAKIRGLDEP